MRTKLASAILTALIYTQGLLGFAGLATVMWKDWSAADPAFVSGGAAVDGIRVAAR